MKKLFASLATYLLLLFAGANTWAVPFANLYAFGDSLSDGGSSNTAVTSIYKLAGGCDLAHPCPPYVDGHYSNGQVAIEYLADKILPGGANPANFFNFSVAGATTGIGNFGDGGSATVVGEFELPGISTVIDRYLALSSPADPNALYFIWGGANDLLTGGLPDAAAQNIADSVSKLIDAGATHFFIPNLPDLGLTPYAIDAGVSEGATGFSIGFNIALASQLADLSEQFSEIDIIQYDAYSFFNYLVDNAESYGFTNTKTGCLAGLTPCTNPEEYIFWDGFHPTTQAHAVFAHTFAHALPLPGVPALFIIGGLALVLSRVSRNKQ